MTQHETLALRIVAIICFVFATAGWIVLSTVLWGGHPGKRAWYVGLGVGYSFSIPGFILFFGSDDPIVSGVYFTFWGLIGLMRAIRFAFSDNGISCLIAGLVLTFTLIPPGLIAIWVAIAH